MITSETRPLPGPCYCAGVSECNAARRRLLSNAGNIRPQRTDAGAILPLDISSASESELKEFLG